MEFTYNLKYKYGRIESVNFEIELSKGSRFKYGNKCFAVYSITLVENGYDYLCWEIDERDFYGNYSVDIRKIEFEEKLLEFFAERAINIEPQTLTEELFKEHTLKLLDPYFHIHREISGEHFSGKKVKLDSILVPKDNSDWRNKNLVFGIEFKNPLVNEMNNRRDEDMLAQCLDYAMSDFQKFNDILIFICPIYPSLEKEKKMFKFLSTYNLGYVDFYNGKMHFKLGTQIVWCENEKTSYLLKNSELKRKFGNRGYKAR